MLLADSLIVIGLSTLSLGTIQEADGPVERTFWLRNAGADSVSIVQGYTSCGCTTISYKGHTPVAPGDSTAVTLRFNPRGKGGEFLETGTVVYASPRAGATSAGQGGQRKRVSLSLEGTCITSEETLLRQFPIRISDSLRLNTDHIDLGIMHPGEQKERSVVVLHGGQRQVIPIHFVVSEDSPKGLQHIPYRITAPGNGAPRQLTIRLDVLVK